VAASNAERLNYNFEAFK